MIYQKIDFDKYFQPDNMLNFYFSDTCHFI